MDAEYHLVSEWRVEARREQVAAILREPRSLVRWWPEVYSKVEIEKEGDERGIGRIVRVHSRGWLPYSLRWWFEVVEQNWPEGTAIRAWGDLTGAGRWTLVEDGRVTIARYDWRVRADKPVLKLLSPVLKPLFAWNHRWAMEKGEAGLKRELERRNFRA